MTADISPPVEGPQIGHTVSPVDLFFIFVAMAALLVITGFLTKAYRSERAARARRYFESGQQLAGRGRDVEAIDQYGQALAITRDSSQYRLALALALMRLDRLNEAQTYLQEVLRTDPTSGIANLMLARIAARQGKYAAAEAGYNRAIYGYWPDNEEQNRIEARFELLDVFGKTGAKQAAVAQLFELLEAVPDDPQQRLRIAQLLLKYGAPVPAADVFREIMRADGQNAAAFAGYGEAEYQLRNYRDAQNALRQAVRLNPGDEAARARLEDADRILALDPTIRGLSWAERYRRSAALAQAAADAAGRCYASSKTEPSEAAAQLLLSARQLPGKRPRNYADAVDDNLALAESLWDLRVKQCGAAPGPEHVLARIFAELER